MSSHILVVGGMEGFFLYSWGVEWYDLNHSLPTTSLTLLWSTAKNPTGSITLPAWVLSKNSSPLTLITWNLLFAS